MQRKKTHFIISLQTKVYANFLSLSIIIFLLTVSLKSICAEDTFITERKKALSEMPKIITNNDGNDAAVFRGPFSEYNLLIKRTIPLKNTDVRGVSYSTSTAGTFAKYSHKSKIAELHDESCLLWKGSRNLAKELIVQNTDSLKITTDYCHKNNFKIFWSLRMNDTHDKIHRPDKPYYAMSKFKIKNPHCLMGNYLSSPPYSEWSAVDFSHEKVRTLYCNIIKEICRNYNIDGIELDFFRHLFIFKSVAKGQKASELEMNQLTDFMQNIRKITEKEGRKRGRPFLVLIRIPDSIEYCKSIGIDLQAWIDKNLFDVLIGSGYFRLNVWTYLVKLKQRNNDKFKVYAGISEPRISGEYNTMRRLCDLTYRARIAAAWQSGVDGIYLFNEYDSRRPYLKEIGSKEKLQKLNKMYFCTYRNFPPSEYLKDGDKYQSIPIVSPNKPMRLFVNKEIQIPIEIGNETSSLNNKPEVKCIVRVKNLSKKGSMSLSINNAQATKLSQSKNLIIYSLKPNSLSPGINKINIVLDSKKTKPYTTILKGDKLLIYPAQLPWRRLYSSANYKEEIIKGAYRISDTGIKDKDIHNLIYPLSNTKDFSCSFYSKVEKSNNPLSVCVRIAIDNCIECLCLEENRIGLLHSNIWKRFNTTSRFHKYELHYNNGNLIIKIDGNEIINAPLKKVLNSNKYALKNYLHEIPEMNTSSLLIGSLSGKGIGSALWKNFKIHSSWITLEDIAILVEHPKLQNTPANLKWISYPYNDTNSKWQKTCRDVSQIKKNNEIVRMTAMSVDAHEKWPEFEHQK